LGRWRQLTKNAKGQVEAVIISRSTREASQPLSLAETKLQYQFAMAARPTGLGRGQKFIKQEPLTALAEQCELAIRQVPRYSRRSDGRFPESSSGCSWPGAPSGQRQLPGFAIQWLFSGDELEGFNFGTVPLRDVHCSGNLPTGF
jgi:hypothetical protein